MSTGTSEGYMSAGAMEDSLSTGAKVLSAGTAGSLSTGAKDGFLSARTMEDSLSAGAQTDLPRRAQANLPGGPQADLYTCTKGWMSGGTLYEAPAGKKTSWIRSVWLRLPLGSL
jgi:hypothetical protein